MVHRSPHRSIHCGIVMAAALIGSLSAWAAGPEVHDVVIHNAVIYDGSGEKPYPGEVAIDGDRIAYVGPPRALKGRSEIDAHGQAVSPGFIDMMGHSEESLLIDGRAVSGLLRGRAWTGASGGGCRASAFQARSFQFITHFVTQFERENTRRAKVNVAIG